MIAPFSDEFRAKLKLGKYSSWAEDLTEEDVRVLLWAVGEFGLRAPELVGDETGRMFAKLRTLDRGHSSAPNPGDQRRDGALRILAQFVHGYRPTEEEMLAIVLGRSTK